MPKYSLNTVITKSSTISVILTCTIALLCYPYLINVLIYVTNFWALAYTGCKVYLPCCSAEQMKYSQAEGYKEFTLYWQCVPDAVFGNPVSFLSLATPWKLFWTRIAVGNSKHYQKFFATCRVDGLAVQVVASDINMTVLLVGFVSPRLGPEPLLGLVSTWGNQLQGQFPSGFLAMGL